MAASLDTAPPARHFSDDPTWITVSTDATIAAAAAIALTITGTGPSDTETIRIQWGGNDLTFTASATDAAGALDLPLIGSDTLSDYADKVAERFAQNEVLHAYFRISRGTSGSDQTVTLTQRTLEVVDITVTNALTNVSESVTDVTAVTASEGLRALVEVWRDTGSLDTDEKLLSLHSPYDLASAATDIDIHAAFASLMPHLPGTSSINPAIFTSLLSGEATRCWMKYYLRLADKSGYPAIAQALLRSDDSYIAMLGSIAADSAHSASAALRHNYVRRDGGTFWKPTDLIMPDWIYWVCPSGVTEIYIHVTITWSDGTQSTFDPFDTDATAVSEGNMYWIGCGFRQLKLHTVTPSGGTDADAYIVRYTAAIARVDGYPLIGTHSVNYQVMYDANFSPLYLLFSNGCAGCEVVLLRGKTAWKYKTASEEFQRPRTPDWTAEDGEFDTYGAAGRQAWESNTGWFDDPAYVEHLRQLPLAAGAWLIDVSGKKFRRVIVEPGEMLTRQEDETIYSLPVTIRAAWQELDSNL